MENICQKSETLDALLPRKFNMTGCINTCGKERYLYDVHKGIWEMGVKILHCCVSMTLTRR